MSSSQERSLVQLNTGSGKPSLDKGDIVIIGNGIAGLTAAVEARHLAPDKRIVMITDQLHPTINTPALKQFAIDKLTREQLLAYPAGTERTERIHVVSGRVETIHAQSKYVSLRGGRNLGYESLLVATGSHPTSLPENIPGRDFDGVLCLHRLNDYLDFRRRMGEVEEAVVIGGGVHAIETVMGLHHWGIRVHWLIRGATLLGKMLDPSASSLVLSNIRRAGVVIHTQTEVAGIVGRIGAVAGVITNHQEMIPCQLVLCCTGTQPALNLAKKSSVPIQYKNGILVDDKMRTTVRDIYAAGDVAAIKNPQTGNYEPRALWYAAVAQGRNAGAMMAGQTERPKPFGAQWHATYLGALYMLNVGSPLTENNKVITLTDTSQGGYRRLAVVDDRLIGYLSLSTAQPDSLAIKRIIDEGLSVRAITRELLKGSFDAREYFSSQRSYTAQKILSGKLPDLALPMPAQRASAAAAPDAGMLVAANQAPMMGQQMQPGMMAYQGNMQPQQMQSGMMGQQMQPGMMAYQGNMQPQQMQSGMMGQQMQPGMMGQQMQPGMMAYQGNVQPQQMQPGMVVAANQAPMMGQQMQPGMVVAANQAPMMGQQMQPGMMAYEEEVSPFSGNLPVVTPVGRASGASNQLPGNAPMYGQMDQYGEELSPFSGNLPALGQPDPATGGFRQAPVEAVPAQVVESTWQPVAAGTRQPKRSIWMYAEANQSGMAD